MFAEYALLAIVFGVLLIGKIVADRQQELQRWFYYYEQKKITVPYPEQIRTWQQIPAAYQDVFPPTDTMPYIIFIPGSRSMLRRRSEKLLVLEHDRLVVYEGNTAAKKEFPFDELLYIDYEKMLSAFWLTLVCQHQTSSIRYLSKEDTCFSTILESLRVRLSQGESSCVPMEDTSLPQKIDEFPHVPYKFLKIARTSLLPGQKIVDVYFQPAYRSKKNLFGQFIGKTVTYAPHLSLLTEKALIVVQESEPIRMITYNQYAVKQLFIPYRSIQEVQMQEENTTIQLIFLLNTIHSLYLCFDRKNDRVSRFFQQVTRMINNK